MSHVLKTLFYIVDNAAVLMNIMHHDQYYIARRASFSIFLVAIFTTLIHYIIKLRRFYKEEDSMKSPVDAGKVLPRQFLSKI